MSKIVWKVVHFEGISEYSGLDELEELCKRARAAEATGEWKDFVVDRDHDGWDDSYRLALFASRKETAEEQKLREQQEAEHKKIRDDFERRQYEALKKKFEEG